MKKLLYYELNNESIKKNVTIKLNQSIRSKSKFVHFANVVQKFKNDNVFVYIIIYSKKILKALSRSIVKLL